MKNNCYFITMKNINFAIYQKQMIKTVFSVFMGSSWDNIKPAG